MRCRCGSSKTETDTASGTIVCVGCGEVLEENTIVSEITFQEISGGKTVLSGSFAGDSGRISGGGPFGRGRGKEGQEQAMDNGRSKIARLAYALHLPERYRESAQRYYNLAVVNRFTRGRKSEHVAAVCLYIVCRNEKSSQMLIDFSDLLQAKSANVFVLGSTFLKLVRTLNLKLPLIDPSIYISRFAAALDFGEYTQRVAHDAVRLVQRMDRDWIRTGRRPAGICGACLLMAARINGFRRTTREMIYIVKVAEITIHSRLKEFKQTESANLSVRDFRNMWLETEADPPAFLKARKEQEGVKKRTEGGSDNEESEKEEEEVEAKKDEEDGSDAESVQSLRRKPTVVAASPAAMSVISHDDMSTTEKAAREKAQENENLSDVDDEEIEAMILNPMEVKIKTRIWYDANKDYLEEMKAKLQKIEMDRRNASTPAEAAKQLLTTKKFSKKINQAVFDGMFETPEAIEKIKEIDKLKEVLREANIDEDTGDYSAYEVVEESGDNGTSKKQKVGKENDLQSATKTSVGEDDDDDGNHEDDDDDDIDLDDMADDERMMLEGRRRMGWTDMGADDDYYDYDDD
ncbi:cyclin-like protein [Zychaea mexicana]|uniref:cyclin-like protein n=1 Tax=Zychaea mexicana TaxID=64656 RepID=UPI0022FF152F|nr:cyclin-like protein [Zychaea mexicana]KAI9492772.1 cyclin-like protein [Zychaea mexicana]